MKTCRVCGETKPLEEFARMYPYYRGDCRKCNAQRSKEYVEANPVKAKLSDHLKWLRFKGSVGIRKRTLVGYYLVVSSSSYRSTLAISQKSSPKGDIE